MLAQLNTLKTRLGIAAEVTDNDALLTAFLQLTSARFELECQRRFAYAAEATFEFRADELALRVDRFPVQSVARFHRKTSEATGWEEITDVEYLLSPARAVIELSATLGSLREVGQVTYAGGYVLPGTTPETGQTPLPVELELSCVEQGAYLFENRNRLGLVSVGGGGGALEILRQLNLLPAGTTGPLSGTTWFKFMQADVLPGVQEVLAHYRRVG